MSTPVPVSARSRANPGVSVPLAVGLFGGLALGVIARAWMRLISTDPKFTWTGTLFIVGGFALFGLAQAIVAVVRRTAPRRSTLTGVRIIGAVAMTPLFVAAGALLAPTVIGGGLAVGRDDWRRITRVACLCIASAPVLFVGHDLIDKHGWSLRALSGFTTMLAIYSTIIWATRFTIAPMHDGWHLPRWARPAITVATCLLFLIALIGGGIK